MSDIPNRRRLKTEAEPRSEADLNGNFNKMCRNSTKKRGFEMFVFDVPSARFMKINDSFLWENE